MDTLSVIIPTCNRGTALGTCLTALAKAVGQIEPNMVEIIVTDDGLKEKTSEIIGRHPGLNINYTQGPKRGPAANRNHSVKYAKGAFLVFIDDDCTPDVNILKAYLQMMEQVPEADVIEGRIVAGHPFKYAYDACPVNETGGYCWSANLCVRAEAYRNLGGFDEDFPFAAMEDVEFHMRTVKANLRHIFCHQAFVTHPVEIRTGRIRNLREHYSVLVVIEKHPDKLCEVMSNYSLIGCLRAVKRNIVGKALIQPVAAYTHLARKITSNFFFYLKFKGNPDLTALKASLLKQIRLEAPPGSAEKFETALI